MTVLDWKQKAAGEHQGAEEMESKPASKEDTHRWISEWRDLLKEMKR